jgi:hypothetical protein
MKNWVKIALLLFCCVAIGFEVWHFRTAPSPVRQIPAPVSQKNKTDFVLLPANEATGIARFFAGPESNIGSWEPTVGDMSDIEANLSQIPALSKEDPDPNKHIDNPDEYFRQYGAVVIDGRRTILVNAFCTIGQDNSGRWRKHLVLVSDGGKCYWKAMYDVDTARFTKVSVNGIA